MCCQHCLPQKVIVQATNPGHVEDITTVTVLSSNSMMQDILKVSETKKIKHLLNKHVVEKNRLSTT
jgi:hypothetical protein